MRSTWITSRGVVGIPAAAEEVEGAVWFNMWTMARPPYRLLANDDELYFFDTTTRRLRWRTLVSEVLQAPYGSKREAVELLSNRFGLGRYEDDRYFQGAPESGYLVAWRSRVVRHGPATPLAGVRLPGDGWLRVDDAALDVQQAWGLDSELIVVPDAWTLQPGHDIRRVELHARYGGRRQGGISPSRATPNVFLFTDPRVGHAHGYTDWWEDGCFFYTGEGQRGDQELKNGNAAILRHRQEGRALRLFWGASKQVRLVGTFELDPEVPCSFMDAPQGDGAERQVVVFKLRPVGDVWHPPEVVTVDRVARSARVELGPVEQQHVEESLATIEGGARTLRRVEHTLTLRLKAFLEAKGCQIAQLNVWPEGELRPLRNDLYNVTRRQVIEAKGSSSREAVRMAIGQVLDYSRFADQPCAVAVLLPSQPRRDLAELLARLGIAAIWPSDDGIFEDSAGGAFV